MPDKPFRIAIVGGSIGGCTLAMGLHQLNRLDIVFDVFEAWTFRERGALVGVHPNGVNALKQMGIDADALLADANAFMEQASEARVAYGEHEGRYLMKIPGGIQGVLRADLLEQMLKRLPEDRLHPNKKLVLVDEGESLTLKFEDGSTYEADALVGCDGLRSLVRGLILGPDHPAVPPEFTGYWDARAFGPSEMTFEMFGSEAIQHDYPRDHFAVGDGCTLLFANAPKGKIGGVIAAGYVENDQERQMLDNPKKPVTREFLEKKYGHWGKSYIKGVIDALLDSNFSPGFLFGEYQARDAPTWFRDRMCIMGDAAHAALPWLGQGFNMAAEDAATMTALLGAIKSHADIPKAFQAFDKKRRGPGSRPEWLLKNAIPVAELLSGRRGLDPEQALHDSVDVNKIYPHLWEANMEEEIQSALKIYQELQSNE